MISPANGCKMYLATRPADFRKGIDGLATHVKANFELDPYSGALLVFLSRCGHRMPMTAGGGEATFHGIVFPVGASG